MKAIREQRFGRPADKLTFESFMELVEYSKDAPDNGDGKTVDSPSWWGTKTFEEAVELAHRGWHEGVKEFAFDVAGITNLLETQTVELGYDVTGQIIDIERAVMGEPECFMEMTPVVERGLVKVIVSVSAIHDVGGDAIRRRGAAIAAMCEELTKHYAVELWAVSTAIGRRDKDINLWIPLEVNPVDVDQLAFVFANPAMLRRFCFAAREVYWKVLYGGHVRSGELRGDEIKDAIYFPTIKSSEGCWDTLNGSAKKVKSMLSNYLSTKGN